MKKAINRFRELPSSKRVQLIAAVLLTVGLLIAIPVYAWFMNQKKAAEMYKVEFPNALYVNAAHREDRIYFALDGININEYAVDPITGETVTDSNGNAVTVQKYRYVFTVSGSNTNSFTLQLAHTTNNLFTYTIYEAEQYKSEDDLYRKNGAGEFVDSEDQVLEEGAAKVFKEGITRDKVVKYGSHKNSHNENDLEVYGDDYVDNSDADFYYVMTNKLDTEGAYVNKAPAGTIAYDNDTYFNKTYDTYKNAEDHARPAYWQAANLSADPDTNKVFCKYYVLEVTWNDKQQKDQTKKETDLVYLSAKRTG